MFPSVCWSIGFHYPVITRTAPNKELPVCFFFFSRRYFTAPRLPTADAAANRAEKTRLWAEHPPQLQGGAGSTRIAPRVRGPAAALAPRRAPAPAPKTAGRAPLPHPRPPQPRLGDVTFKSEGLRSKGKHFSPQRVLRPPSPGASRGRRSPCSTAPGHSRVCEPHAPGLARLGSLPPPFPACRRSCAMRSAA